MGTQGDIAGPSRPGPPSSSCVQAGTPPSCFPYGDCPGGLLSDATLGHRAAWGEPKEEGEYLSSQNPAQDQPAVFCSVTWDKSLHL